MSRRGGGENFTACCGWVMGHHSAAFGDCGGGNATFSQYLRVLSGAAGVCREYLAGGDEA